MLVTISAKGLCKGGEPGTPPNCSRSDLGSTCPKQSLECRWHVKCGNLLWGQETQDPHWGLLRVEVKDQGMDEILSTSLRDFFKRTRSCWDTCPYSSNTCRPPVVYLTIPILACLLWVQGRILVPDFSTSLLVV